jgi:hypothetical protein
MRPQQHSAGAPATQDRRAHRAPRVRPARPANDRLASESLPLEGPRLSVVGPRQDAEIDERVAHFFVIVATLCGDARLGRLTLRLKLANGEEIAGVAEPVRETEGLDELGGIGYADAVTVDGVAVALSDVIEASIAHPGGGRTLG